MLPNFHFELNLFKDYANNQAQRTVASQCNHYKLNDHHNYNYCEYTKNIYLIIILKSLSTSSHY